MTDQPEHEYRILTVDGGGIKGVFAASFLAELEHTLGEPLVDYFDLISGTSTGGIIALGLGMGLSAAEILSFYETHGPKIFGRAHLGTLRQWTSAKYSNEPLKEALEAVFGGRLLGESTTRLMIPSLNLETGEVHVFKTAHHERFVRDHKERVVDIALATAAAPTFFPAHYLESGTPLIDGGMWANNPMGAAAVEALGVLDWPKGSIKLLGVGCTTPVASNRGSGRRGRGKLYWATRVADTFMAGQSSSSVGTAQLLLGHPNVHRVSPTVSASMYKLDGVAGIKSLRGLGASEARKEYPKVSAMFFASKAEKFVAKGVS
ncbi:MAG: CBASS cGAMP-activated phospholipase [Actinomycetota bacterium]